jgi:hypothetical protein
VGKVGRSEKAFEDVEGEKLRTVSMSSKTYFWAVLSRKRKVEGAK